MDAMKRVGAGPVDGDPNAPSVLDRQPIGAYLKRQRELRGITAEELARVTRIPLRSLERLETGTFDGEVDGFVRGFVRTVAAALGLDPDETVARMLAEPLDEETPGYAPSPAVPRALFGVVVVTVLALAIGLVRIASTGDVSSPRPLGDDVVYRVDPVRSLADSQAGVEASTPAAVAAPPPDRAPNAPR